MPNPKLFMIISFCFLSVGAQTIYNVDTTNQTYNFTTHDFDGTVGGLPGVAFRFTAPSAGGFAIIVEDVESTSKYILDYGTDQTFNTYGTVIGGATGTMTMAFTASSAGEIHYFSVYTGTSSYYTNNFKIRYKTALTLTINNDGHGTTTPSGATAVASSIGQTISASPVSGYRFSHWSVTSGSATFADSTLYSTTVTITSNATIRANFKTGTVYQITNSNQTYNFTTHYYTGASPGTLPGVAFRFTAPSAGSYAIIVGDVDSTYKYLYDYGSDASFGSYSTYTYGYGSITIVFTASAANETHYFGVRTSSTLFYTDDFTIRYGSPVTLTVENDGHGTTSPSGTATVAPGAPQTITVAAASTGYRFNNWTVINGNATFGDPAAYSTIVTLSSNATIRANFSQGSIYPITGSDVTYNFTTHYYTGATPGTLPGVAFRFTAPSAGSYAIIVGDVDSTYKYLYDYGSDASFGSYSTYTYGYGSITIVFTASAANETHYFGVRTSSTSFYTDDFTIRYGSPVTLTVENDGNGATSPSGAISVAPDAPRSISASPAIGYRFNNWTVTSGNATFADPAAYSTTVTLTSNATIRANFSQGSIYPVTATDVTYNFTTHYYTGATPGTMPGVAFRFTAPSAGSYAIVVEDVEASSKYIFDYGVDSTFTSYLNYTSGSGTLTFMFTASAANEKHYFGVRPSSSSYYTNNFTIRYGTASTLTVEHSGFGTTTPSGDVALLAGASRSISATTTSSVSYFDHWELVSGNATISSPSSSSTTVTVNSGDATVRAVFLMHPVDTLIINSTNGVTFPSDTVFILTGNDTSVTATPNGGYMFTSWTVVQGNATLGNASNPLTSVQVVNGKATIRANFVVDPNARPHLSISGIDISGHPDICITASVTDTAGRSITGLDSSFFTLREDGTSLPFHLSTVTERGGTSVCLVIDKSGSMSGTPMAQAIAAAQTYINSMNPLDRCAIVAFESTASLVQGMTSDKAALNSAVSGLIGTGGTDILAGTNLGIAQLVQETNPRSVIVFSDGQGASSPPLDSVIRFARNNDVTIYSIGIGSASTSPLRELADSTGGYFVTAPTAAELAEIYDKIKRDVEARYILCYETPDTIFNGDTHTVVVSVTLNNKTSRDTTVWDESNKPPVVTLTSATQALIGNNQPDNTAITITANVTDEGTITNVRLFYRITGSGGAYTEIPMTIQSGNTYGAVIPAGSVLSPGIDFYIVATDNYNLIGRSPNVLSPETKPWVIPVYGNRLSISVISDTAVDEGSLLFIHVTATDSDGTIPAITASGLPGSATFTDSGNGAGLFSWDIGCSGHGVYSVVFKASDGIDSVQATLALTVRDSNFAPEFLSTNDTAAPENQQLTLTVRTEDCDGDVPKIKAISIPSGSAFSDNGDGTATLEWTPDCDDNGYYIVVFEAADDHTAVRDTILIRITDVNCFEPRMTLSEVELSTGVNLSVSITVHASDSDGTVPTLEANDLPSGAQFTADGDGNAVFSWTPTSIGTFTPTIVAVDAVDAAVRIDTTVTITVSDNNFTGPVFRTCLDTIIDENQLLNLVIAADDPDGTIPTLQPLSLPEEATFIDNNNGSAVIAWRPGCAMHGNHLLSATATDGTFSDTLTVLVTVRDQNCPPVINPVSDKNITYGSTIRFSVGATDPDNDIIPELSVSCALPGYTFTLDDSGSGTFEWNASYSSGSYVVTFYASDGFLADTETVTIAVDKAGSIHIVAEPSDALLFICPASGATGTFLGTGSATFTHVPGTYWFRAQTPGYRSSIFTGAVTADAACTLSVKLKTIIPLMVSPPETAQMGTADDVDLAGSIAFVDFDADGIQDLSVADGTTLRIFPGSDGEKGLRYRVPAISINVPSTLDSIVAHTYCDWNNDGAYECLLSLKGGAIHVARFDNEDLVPDDEILNCPGETLFPAVADLNADLRKDLLVVSGGKGAYLYFNNDDDEAPAFDTPVAVTGEAAETLDGNPLLWDFDGDGRSDLIAAAGDHLQFFSSSGDSTLHELPAGEDFNAGGQRIPRNGSSAALLMLSQSAPRLAVLSEGTVSVYQLRLLGDVTGDGTVNIADISKISKAWELSEKDEGWNPACNLRLSASGGGEVIDINDISRAAKNWEMQE